MTRKEHIEWAKRRALEYLDSDDPGNAIVSMLSDLGKHEETKDLVIALGMLSFKAMAETNQEKARQFIEGFH